MDWTSGDLIGFDLETTGLDLERARPVSFAICWINRGVVCSEQTSLVNPGIPIPPEATAIHGITTSQALEEGMDLQQATQYLVEQVLQAGKARIPITGMNLSFDLTILDRLARESCGNSLAELGWSGPALDALVLDRHCDRFRKGHRTLPALCCHYGVPLFDAHRADADARAATLVVLEIAERYPELAGMDLERLYAAQVEWYREWAVSYSDWLVRTGKTGLGEIEHVWPIRVTR